MPFKEKIAWISLVTTVVVWGAYFSLLLAAVIREGAPGRGYVVGFTAAVVVQVVLVIVASVIAAVTSPRDAEAGADERDRSIGRRSSAVAYPVLLALIVCVAASMHFGVRAPGMAYGIMAAIVIAEIVHYGAQILSYRRGWHG